MKYENRLKYPFWVEINRILRDVQRHKSSRMVEEPNLYVVIWNDRLRWFFFGFIAASIEVLIYRIVTL